MSFQKKRKEQSSVLDFSDDGTVEDDVEYIDDASSEIG